MRGWVYRIAILVALVCIALLAGRVDADDYVSAMVGVFNSGKDSLAETKFANVGHRGSLGLGLSYQVEGGGWVDTAGRGRRGSVYGATQVGVEARNSVVARLMVGPALVSQPDAYLGTPFEFTEDFFFGVCGKNGNVIGVKYKHLSNAGLSAINMGRDLAGVEASITF